MKPLQIFWDDYIDPDLQEYIERYASIDNFISIYEQEYIIRPSTPELIVEFEYQKDRDSGDYGESDKWFTLGHPNKALELDKLYLNNKINNMAKQWSYRGYPQVAMFFQEPKYDLTPYLPEKESEQALTPEEEFEFNADLELVEAQEDVLEHKSSLLN